MKKLVLFTMAIGLIGSAFAQTRYVDEVFTNVTVSSDVVYGTNITVMGGSPAPEQLKMDVYAPSGDTLSERPVVVYVHTGSFLPVPFNGGCTGSKLDSAVVEMCTQFAKRGFVAAAIDYRLGWNPIGNQDERTGTLINAVYRGLQDTKNAVRYFRYSQDSLSNPYKIDPNQIMVVGQGSGGYIALAYATLDKPGEITLPKFIDFNTGDPYVDTTLSGNYDGLGGMGLNLENYPSYSSDVCMVANLGGALGDSTWLEAGDVPMVAFHCPNDIFAPYGYGAVIVPTTGGFVVNVSGSYDAIRRANRLGNNDVFVSAGFSDAYTNAANADNDGHEGLFPLVRPTPESAPWEWWNTACPNDSTSHLTNPDMSKTKALAYIDTIMEYLTPRMVAAFCEEVGINERELSKSVNVYPNPATEELNIVSSIYNNNIEFVEFFDATGRLVYSEKINTATYKTSITGLNTGMYFVNIQLREGNVVKKVLIK